MNKDLKIKIEYVDINVLKPVKYNPRFWDDEVISGATESIRRFGIVDPLIINSSPNLKNNVVGGHLRLKILKDLGYKNVPVVYVNISDPEKEKELNIRLNKNLGKWDFDLLKEFDVDLLLDVGFDDSDLGHIWDENLGIEEDEFDIKKELEKIKVPKAQPGNLFELGSHRLLCADSLVSNNVQKLVHKDLVDMLYFDSPYNIGLSYNNGIGTKGKYGGKKTKDNKSETEYKKFLSQILKNGLEVAKQDCHVFSWCDETYIGLLQEIYKELGVDNKRVCLWIKNNANMTPQIAFNKVYEPCIYGIRGKPHLAEKVTNINDVLNKEIGTGNRVPDDILDLLNIWLAKRVAGQEYEHPTEKPVTLHEKPLRRCTKPGDIVLDLYGGSGSTLIACEQLKRKAFLCEIEPVFCDLIIRRYEKLTGRKAKKCK